MENKDIVIYGMGNRGKKILALIEKTQYCNVSYVVDRNYMNLSECRYKIFPVDRLRMSEDYDYIIIAIDSDEIKNEVEEMLVSMGIDKKKILSHYKLSCTMAEIIDREFKSCYPNVISLEEEKYQKARSVMPFVSVEDAQGYRWLFDSKDTGGISDIMFRNKDESYQKDDIDLYFSLSEKYYYKSGLQEGIFLDIGGNVGTTSIPVKKERDFITKVVAFEPSIDNCKIFRANCAINNIDISKDIVLENIGISNVSGISELALSDNNMGDHRIQLNHDKEVGGNFEQIELKTLEEYFSGQQMSFDDVKYIWIDTQGHEGFVLDGAKKLLQSRKIPLLIEFWPDEMRRVGGLDSLLNSLKDIYTGFIDIGKHRSGDGVRPIEELGILANEYINYTYTDIFLIK
ncbi:FkbM family methyltransferase [Lacrimispora sp.]|jgi:FkbM family methyltransferase|uniref:FkbM family methyltransferase n=1 Tax=Lacrimispora sp. TaxID=2719234 RepID=UPI0028AD347F|nr:FkbM family methyltransferase [Lacrimispora sp.]